MKFIDFYGRLHGIDFTKYNYKNSETRTSGEQRLLDYLLNSYPNTLICEQFPCLGTGLRLDFFIPFYRTAYEFDGEQHNKFVQFFHKSMKGLILSKERDRQKEKWCKINNIELVRYDKNDL